MSRENWVSVGDLRVGDMMLGMRYPVREDELSVNERYAIFFSKDGGWREGGMNTGRLLNE